MKVLSVKKNRRNPNGGDPISTSEDYRRNSKSAHYKPTFEREKIIAFFNEDRENPYPEYEHVRQGYFEELRRMGGAECTGCKLSSLRRKWFQTLRQEMINANDNGYKESTETTR